MNDTSEVASPLRLKSPSTAALYNKRFEPLWKREGTVRFNRGSEMCFTTNLTFINFLLSFFQILERLDHVSIVRLEEVFYAEGKVLMVLEYLPGGDLFDGLVSRPFYSEKDACACAHQIITALNYLSKKGIIHRVRNDTVGHPINIV